ncbi:hypothetical protein [Paenisporosarcina antarctica]|uniref:DUF1440 domain-containing protein n=1 Tax=Paenisporosarcina antarctica TaxID=417367 RepID=A0A4P6ZZB3_9BACL|nr:hypothetical protein [Paenisporosarcina antarctica]QBP41588.1 hypothetical protein E2636_10730 [Paenisporosarcina antarctica]
MTRPTILKALYLGVVSGILLGLLLKLIESITTVRVYTLLLNIDFIPIIGGIAWGETVEFIFHVLVSIVIAFIFVYLVIRLRIEKSFTKLLFLSFILCLPTFFLYFLLSSLAIKEVPAWNDWLAFTYWSVAHLFYVWVLPVLYKKM